MPAEEPDLNIPSLQAALHQAADAWRRSHALHDPDWEPLEELLGPCRTREGGGHSPACGFMFMGMAAGPPSSGGIRLYKHGICRRDEALRKAGFIVLSADISSPTADGGAGA
jgi:hypothetical protein